jgi:integrase
MSFMVNGKSIFRSTKTSNKAQAQKIENETRKKMIDESHFEKLETVTLKKIIDEYLKTREGTKGLIKDKVYARKTLGHKMCPKTRKLSKVFGFSGDMPFHDLKTRDLFKLWMARKSEGMKPATFIHELLFFNGLIKIAKNLGYQTPNINIQEFKKEHKIRPGKGKLRYLAVEEEAMLLKELHPDTPVKGLSFPEHLTLPARRARQDVYDLTVLLLDTGARHSEITQMKWASVDFENGLINLYRTKVSNESAIPMTDRVKAILLRRWEDKEESLYIFNNKSNDGGRNYSPVALKAACRRAGIDGVSFHTLRHTTASRLAQANVSLQDIACLLGHTTIAMTQRYSHLQPSESLSRSISILNK